ncbi:MAG: TetR/AcrR family transcriptional regulator [Microthrixaceae bacterium]
MPSRREDKKARTRRALVAVSHRLFSRQGYAETTLEQICAEVGVHPQTLLRYFDSKADLALAPMRDVVRSLTDQLADPHRELDALEIWRHHVETQAGRHNRAVARYLAWLDADPVLRAMLESLTTLHEDALAAALADDRGADPEDLRSMLLASTLVRGNSAITRRWMAEGADPETLASRQLAVIDLVLLEVPRWARPDAATAGRDL